MSEPAYREFKFKTMVGDDTAECISILSQVMKSYPTADSNSIAEWFYARYKRSDPLEEKG